MKKVLVVFGTRPEAIKMAPLILALNTQKNILLKICVTAQHRQMLDQVLEIFGIIPDFDLDLMTTAQSLEQITSSVLLGVTKVLDEFRPDLVLVHGDTTTTFAASLASFYRRIAVGHVEAGLRTRNKLSPWPEEMNRRIVSAISDVHFAPTEGARDNLLRDGVAEDRIIVTGNTVVDSLRRISERLDQGDSTFKTIARNFRFLDKKRRLILVTGHRRENFGAGLEGICEALVSISRLPDVEIVYPVHLNPNVQEPVNKLLRNAKNIHLLRPLDYLSFYYLLSICHFVITDSGGIQEEAPTMKKPVLVLRESTERPEAINSGSAILVGTNPEAIVSNAKRLLSSDSYYKKMIPKNNPFGDGHASARIVRWIDEKFGV